MKRVFLMAMIFAIFSASCKKENSDTELTPIPAADYMQLKVGNFWVYEGYRIDTTGIEVPSTYLTDSLVIIGDTNIGNEVYFKRLSTNSKHMSYLRDSSGYLVDRDGRVLFSDHDFTNIIRIDTIGPGLAYIEYMMHDRDCTITTPLGTYPSLEFRGKVIATDPQYPHGINYTHYFYADGVGMIKSSNYFFSAPHLRVGQRLTNFGNIGD